MVAEVAVLVLALTFGDDALWPVQAQQADGKEAGVRISSCEAAAPDAGTRDIVEAFAQTLPVGSRVKIRLMDTQMLKGTFLGVDGGRLIIRLISRQPQPALRFAPRAIFSLEALDSGARIRKPGVGKARLDS